MVHFDGTTINFRNGLHFNVVAKTLVLALPRHVTRELFRDELREMISFFFHVVHA
jgi:hypothetical protein